MFTSFSPIISPKKIAAATHSARPEMPKYLTARSSNGLRPRSEVDVVLDLAILTKKSSAGRIQRTSAGVVERRTIGDGTKPLRFVTQFHFAPNLVRLPLTDYVFGGTIPGFDTRSGSCPVPGPPLSKILPGIRRPTLSMFKPTRRPRSIQ